MSVLSHLQPSLIWKYFEEITRYPRPSKQEEKIAAYIVSFAEQNGLSYRKDDIGNIVINKPATKGREKAKGIILQGHLDMVCEKNRGVEHDFDNDPIDIYIDGDYVKARGTTLGADNGIGVAAALAVLADDSFDHGPIECLFTLDEETGLTGASNMTPNFVNGKILLNLDSEEEGALFIGCSGGKNTTAKMTFTKEKASSVLKFFEVRVQGLIGGHSGLEIHSGRVNAIKILTRALYAAISKFELRLISIEGGNKHNAIPREAFAKVALPPAMAGDFIRYLKEFNEMVFAESSTVEKNLVVDAVETEPADHLMDYVTTDNLLNALYAVPHGVIKMSADIPGLVETSTNLATIKTNGDTVVVVTSQRSSVASENMDIVNTVSAPFKLAQADITYGDGYPGWKPNLNSEILGIVVDTHKKLFGKEPELKAIHAGLECGIIGEKNPGLDMISFGPTMFDVHSPDERLKISSVPNFYKLLTNVISNIPY